MDKNMLALADVVKHKTLGTVSYQGIDKTLKDDEIFVRDIMWILHIVYASDCDTASIEDADKYWRRNKQ